MVDDTPDYAEHLVYGELWFAAGIGAPDSDEAKIVFLEALQRRNPGIGFNIQWMESEDLHESQ